MTILKGFTIMKRRLVIILFATVLCSNILHGANPPAKFIDAVSLFDNEKYTEAARILKALTASSPDDGAVWYYLGMSQASLGDMNGAAASLRKAVELDPHNYWYKERLSTVYEYLKEEDLTISIYEDLVTEFPRKTDILFKLLNLYYRNKQYDKAVTTLTDIENVHGRNEQIASAKYDLLRHIGRDDEAVAYLRDFNAEYSSPSTLSMLGDYYMQQYNDTSAMSCYDEALAVQGDYLPALLGKSEVYRTTRRYPEYFAVIRQFIDTPTIPVTSKSMYLSNVTRSLDPNFLKNYSAQFDSLFDAALTLHPTDSSILKSAGFYNLAVDRLPESLRLFSSAAEAYPDNVALAATYVQALSYAKQWEQVRDISNNYSDIFPDEPGFIEYANAASYRLGDYRAVIDGSMRIINMFPSDTSYTLPAWSTIGDMYHSLGDIKASYAAYDKALRINPGYAPVLNNYAWFLSIDGGRKALKKAYAMSKKAIEAEPDNATYLDTFAWILHLQGKDAEAKPIFKHAMLYGGKDSSTVLFHYAEVLYALKEYDLAQVYYRQALSKDDGSEEDMKDIINTRLATIKK